MRDLGIGENPIDRVDGSRWDAGIIKGGQPVADGAEAVRAYGDAKDTSEPFRAVILDLTVPGGMGGLEALHRLRELDPGVRALVASGYATDPVLADHETYGFGGAVIKPFRAADLAEALAKLLAPGAEHDG